MPLLKSISYFRLIAVTACLSAVVAYSSYTPKVAYACAEGGCCVCVSAGVEYSGGDCKGKAECVCMYQNGQCVGCQWVQGSSNCNGPAPEEGPVN
jgi:hypothetical protein